MYSTWNKGTDIVCSWEFGTAVLLCGDYWSSVVGRSKMEIRDGDQGWRSDGDRGFSVVIDDFDGIDGTGM